MNANKLRAVMILNNDKGGDLAKALGISHPTFSAKLNGKGQFTQGEIQTIKERYSLTAEQIDDIFFNIKAS